MLRSNGYLLLPSPSLPFCHLLTLRRYAEPCSPSSFVATMADNGMMDTAEEGGDETCDFGYLILRPDGGGLVDLARFLVSGGNARRFLQSSEEEDGGGLGRSRMTIDVSYWCPFWSAGSLHSSASPWRGVGCWWSSS